MPVELPHHVAPYAPRGPRGKSTGPKSGGWSSDFAMARTKENARGTWATRQEHARRDPERVRNVVRLARAKTRLMLGAPLLVQEKYDDRAVWAAVRQNWQALRLACSRLRSNVALATLAVQQDGRALKYVLCGRHGDYPLELAKMAVKKNKNAIKYVPEEFKVHCLT